MRGEVLHYDEGQGFGFIAGADGDRYTFTREDIRSRSPVGRGTQVEFQAGGSQAKNVFSISIATSEAPAVPRQQFGRTVAGVSAASGPDDGTGLWSYFRRGLTANYAAFRGRARRKEYWGFYLFWMLCLVAATLAGLAVDGASGNLDSDFPIATIAFAAGFVLATIIPCVAITVRRQHDIGLSGWFSLLILLPTIGGLIILIFSLIPSQKHENRWRPVPAGIRV